MVILFQALIPNIDTLYLHEDVKSKDVEDK